MVVKLILLIDIGNTNIVLGISKDNQIINTFRYVTNSLLTEDDYYQKISSSLNILKMILLTERLFQV